MSHMLEILEAELDKNKERQKYLTKLALDLDNAQRLGGDKDIPEGNRWIQISDTLAHDIAANLRRLA